MTALGPESVCRPYTLLLPATTPAGATFSSYAFVLPHSGQMSCYPDARLLQPCCARGGFTRWQTVHCAYAQSWSTFAPSPGASSSCPSSHTPRLVDGCTLLDGRPDPVLRDEVVPPSQSVPRELPVAPRRPQRRAQSYPKQAQREHESSLNAEPRQGDMDVDPPPRTVTRLPWTRSRHGRPSSCISQPPSCTCPRAQLGLYNLIL